MFIILAIMICNILFIILLQCICPTASRIDMLYLLNQMPLEITVSIPNF